MPVQSALHCSPRAATAAHFSRSARLLALALALATAGSASLLAHDVWIEPTTFAPKPGDLVGARLKVGDDLIGDPLPNNPALIEQFVVVDSGGRAPVVGRKGADPAGVLRVARPGLLVIAYGSRPSRVELDAAKFNQYLVEEGLDAVTALRAKRGQSGASARELFSRCAKSLVLAGSPGADDGDTALGLTLELVAERNPYAMRAGHELPLRLIYQGRPLAGALVVAMNRADPSSKLTARSDGDGRVRFRLPRAGMWLIKAVHMVPSQTADADWESFWASLTFQLPEMEHAATSSR